MPSPISTRVIAPKYPMFFDPKKKGDFVELPDDVEFNCEIKPDEKKAPEKETVAQETETKQYVGINIGNTQAPVIEVPVSEPEPINPVESTVAEDREAAILTEEEGLPDTQENVAPVEVEEVVTEEPAEVTEETKPAKAERKSKSKKK